MAGDPLSPSAAASDAHAAKFMTPGASAAIPSAALASGPTTASAASWAAGVQEQRRQKQRDDAAAAAMEREASASTLGKAFRMFSSKMTPTNYNMLLFRTLNRDLCLPNANDDYIAPLFRDRLMPVRSWAQRTLPGMAGVTRRGVENPAIGVPGVCNFVDARTKWLDSALKAALDSGVRQVCCIAAGYDTRAYRFCRQGVKFYEIDLPSASSKKQALVKSVLPGPEVLPRPVYVAADLGRVTLGQALQGTGFDPSQPTVFTCEGLIYYLPEDAVATLIASVADLAAPGSSLLFDFLHADAVDGTAFYPGYHACADSVAGKGEAFISGLVPEEEEMAAYVAPLNWRMQRLWSARQMAAAQLPHEVWSEELPPILSFYSYCEVVKPGPQEAAGGWLASRLVLFAANDSSRISGVEPSVHPSIATKPDHSGLERELSLIEALAAAELK
ncbi:hypothetical protein D9Q98_009095 [Chlorella vulgaris]|uniref:S-adenosyl-L-methionine-dependent methyltransferase n=1 Tax=Chlorella vulgaris TaxID=3077 RepID=A0A9D4YTC0_CHLVU|nr:hypothetical protein D9Q98_009095 [Chlorella vulgaris]